MNVSTAELTTHFHHYLVEARQEPIFITQNNQTAGVLLAMEEYERLQYLEDLMWVWRAKEAQRSGYLPDAVTTLQQLLEAAAVTQ